jgi:hypothetical protein
MECCVCSHVPDVGHCRQYKKGLHGWMVVSRMCNRGTLYQDHAIAAALAKHAALVTQLEDALSEEEQRKARQRKRNRDHQAASRGRKRVRAAWPGPVGTTPSTDNVGIS